jgi:tripartite-type tricarboxylate transporter receptor subunit TctC
MRSRAVFAVLGLLLTASALEAQAQTPGEFYKGKQITLITSASVGGGYDQYARLLARHMPRFIPGNPTIVVQNMPGADGIRAANYLYNVAPKDGTVLGGLSRNNGVILFYEPDKASVQFDPRKFHWLGSPQQEIGLFVLRTEKGAKSIDDTKRIEVSVSSPARSSPASIYPRMLNSLIDTKIKPVEGYGGSQESLLALERKEVDGHVSGGSSAAFRARIAPMLKAGEASVVLQMGMTRDAEYPDVPTAIEIMPTAEGKQLFEIAFAEQVMGRPFVMPPGVPVERVKALRDAFDAAVKDPELLADAKAQKMEIDPVTGAAINALLDRVYAAPPALAARMREIAK